ncbi:IclR family transcriptional regulator [Teredinibacter turnerae]|uniref:IclR family transcriptional regulator n=1 Tax=Teredinibacter turnerae TaxID=2426 RepID=UPI0030D21BD2
MTKAPKTDDERRYKAPALAKGLDILELLALERAPLSNSQMASKLGRSISELFRMVVTLEERGYIEQQTDGFVLTNKLFSLGLAQTRVRNLIETSLAEMKNLADKVGQSCHLTVCSNGQIVVVSRVENPRDLGFSVRIGYRRPLAESTSGAVLCAYHPMETKQKILAELGLNADQEREFLMRILKVEQDGYAIRASDFVEGVTDISVPILENTEAVAALTVPHVQCKPELATIEGTLQAVKLAVSNIATLMNTERR